VTYEEIKQAWNNEADEYNCWEALGEDEKVMFAYRQGLEEAAKYLEQESKLASDQECFAERDTLKAIAKSIREGMTDMENLLD